MTNKVFTAFYVYFGVMVLGVSGKIRNFVNSRFGNPPVYSGLCMMLRCCGVEQRHLINETVERIK